MTANLSALIARLEAGPVYLTHKEAYDLAIFFGSDTALGMASLIRKAFAGGSLDAALALAERVLPGWYWRAGRTPLGHWHHGRYTYGWAHVSRTDASNCDRGDEATGWAATPAIALVIATLRAKLDGYAAEGEVNKNPKAQEG